MLSRFLRIIPWQNDADTGEPRSMLLNAHLPRFVVLWSCSGRCGRTLIKTPKINVIYWLTIFSAFGIFVGYAADLAFYYVPDKPGVTGLNWRLMMGSAMFPAV